MDPISKTNVAEENRSKGELRTPALEFKRLSSFCRRGAFSCGDHEIDKWFRSHALNHHEGLKARVVTAHLIGNNNPVGFYAMTMRLGREDELETSFRLLSRPDEGYFTSVHLSWVAVIRPMQRQGVGTVVMGHALREFYEVAVRTGVFALTLVAIDQETSGFYEKLGFVKYGDPSSARPKLLLPAASVIAMVEAAE